MTEADIHQHLQQRFGDAITAFDADVLNPTVHVAPASLHAVASHLHDDSALQFDSLMCLSSVDWGDDLGVVYHFFSNPHRHKITLKVTLPRDHPTVASVAALWPTADWHEREAFDMMGIVFENHPDLRRILCPDDWEGYPLRKDYVVQDFYQGMYVPYPGIPPEADPEGHVTDDPTDDSPKGPDVSNA